MTPPETTTTMVEFPHQDTPFDEAQLAAAAFLAEMLGGTIRTAVDCVHGAGGDWANYAATTANSRQN